MPSKFEVLDQLKQGELLVAVDRLGLEVGDRRTRGELIEALVGSPDAGLADILGEMPHARLTEICRALDLDGASRSPEDLLALLIEPELTSTAEAPAAGKMHASLEPSPGKRAGKLLTREILDRLWHAAERLRGLMDSGDYQDYILGLFLLKRLSDRFEEESETALAEGGDPEDPDEHQFYVPAEARWGRLRKATMHLGEVLNRATAALEDANPILGGVLSGTDYNDERRLGNLRRRDQLLGELISRFSELDLRNGALGQTDILGYAFEDLVRRFADRAGPITGEFYTPREVVQLMVEILQPREGMRICDPACGSGGMLIQCAQHVAGLGGHPQSLSLFGQERDLKTWALCKMNLVFHGLPDARIEKGDTLRDPKLVEGGALMLFDIVIANPPMSLTHWGWEQAQSDPWKRFRYGLPPKSNADFAFLQHMIATLSPRGRMAALIAPGILFRGGHEAAIRRALIEEDLIEAVIDLPPGILFNTKVQPSILVVNRAKSPERKAKVLLVTAEPLDDARQTRDRLASGRLSIADDFREFREREGRAKVVSLDEIASQDFSLRPSVYFFKAVTGERLDRIAEILQTRGVENRGRAESSDPSTDEMPVIQGRDLGGRGLAKEHLARWPVPARLSSVVFVQKGDILLQRIGQRPKAMLVGKSLEGALASDTVYVIRLREEHFSKGAYLVDFFNSPAGQKRIASTLQAAVVPTLNLSTLRALRVPLPDPRISDLFGRVRSLEDDLLDRIQRTLDIKAQLFESQNRASVEAELRRLSLDAELLRASLVRSEELDFQIHNFYPHMISYRYRRLSSLYDPSQVYIAQLGLLDTLLVFLGSVGLALATHGVSLEALRKSRIGKEWLLEIWQRGPSHGHWVTICREVARIFKQRESSPAANAFGTMWSSQLERTLENLIKIRNNDAHRQRDRSRRDFERDSKDIRQRLDEVLKACLFFVQHPIRLVDGISMPWRERGAVLLNTLVYTGDHPSLRREEARYHSPLPEGHLYLELEPGSWLPLYPLLSVEELGGERRTYAIDKFDATRQRTVLKNLESGHDASQEHSREIGEDLLVWLDETFGSEESHAIEA